ncbi:hypothetical protein D3C76_556050 [compost metagenome]
MVEFVTELVIHPLQFAISLINGLEINRESCIALSFESRGPKYFIYDHAVELVVVLHEIKKSMHTFQPQLTALTRAVPDQPKSINAAVFQ